MQFRGITLIAYKLHPLETTRKPVEGIGTCTRGGLLIVNWPIKISISPKLVLL